MFGYVTASVKELTKEQYHRYSSVYCGICRQIRERASNLSRLGLSYDMAFLALLLMSLYEPEETAGSRACALHPCKSRGWVDNEFVRYAADMNVILAFWKAADDLRDDGNLSAKIRLEIFGKNCRDIEKRYPRQCRAISQCIAELSQLERENCPNADEPANCFGRLMAELFVYREDIWSDTLRQMGMALGRFIYLADAARDFRRDKRKNKYNPYLATDTEENWPRWQEYLVLAMGKCTYEYEKLPLVQDKALLDNILYSGVWMKFRRKERKKQEEKADG
jgi:hypothetical protein